MGGTQRNKSLYVKAPCGKTFTVSVSSGTVGWGLKCQIESLDYQYPAVKQSLCLPSGKEIEDNEPVDKLQNEEIIILKIKTDVESAKISQVAAVQRKPSLLSKIISFIYTHIFLHIHTLLYKLVHKTLVITIDYVLTPLFKLLRAVFTSLWDYIIVPLFNNIISPFYSSVASPAAKHTLTAISKTMDWIGSITSPLVEHTLSALRRVGDWISTLLRGVSTLLRGVSTLIRSVLTRMEAMWSSIFSPLRSLLTSGCNMLAKPLAQVYDRSEDLLKALIFNNESSITTFFIFTRYTLTLLLELFKQIVNISYRKAEQLLLAILRSKIVQDCAQQLGNILRKVLRFVFVTVLWQLLKFGLKCIKKVMAILRITSFFSYLRRLYLKRTSAIRYRGVSLDIRPNQGRAYKSEIYPHDLYVMQNNTIYSITLTNKNAFRIKATIQLDSRMIGVFKLDANSTYVIERPAFEDKQFKFVATSEPLTVECTSTGKEVSTGVIKVILERQAQNHYPRRVNNKLRRRTARDSEGANSSGGSRLSREPKSSGSFSVGGSIAIFGSGSGSYDDDYQSAEEQEMGVLMGETKLEGSSGQTVNVVDDFEVENYGVLACRLVAEKK